MGAMRNAYKILIGKPEGRRPLGRPTHRWKDNIRMNVEKDAEKLWTEFISYRILTSGGLL
jgi:hypothetical protein